MLRPNIGVGEFFFLRLLELSKEDRVAQIFADDGSTMSFRKLLEHSVHAAVGLTEMGLKSGKSTLSLIIRNSHELFPIVLGCLMADIKIVPTIAELPVEDLASGLKTTKPTHVLTAPKTVPTIEKAIKLSELDPPPNILALTDDLYKDIIAKGSHVDPEDYTPVKIDNPGTHVAVIYFSSGTTGPQKAVAIPDSRILRGLFNGRRSVFRHDGPILSMTQCNWVTWFYGLGASLFNGRVRVFMNLIDIKRILDAIQTYKCNTWNAPPRVLIAAEKALDANPGVWDISSLKLIMSGGDFLKDVIQDRLEKKFGADIYQEYGSTELGLVFVPDVFKPVVLGSIGKPVLPVKLVDPETDEDIMEPNKPGELYCKDWVMLEYVDNPKATADAIKGDWMPSGDLMYFDQNGNFFFIERIKEIFKYNGNQVSPSELEVFITRIPEVIEAAVVGKRDLAVGCYPTAFIVKRPGSNLSADDVNNFIEQCKLPDWYRLRGGVIFTNELPKTGSGKVMKKKLWEIVNDIKN